MENKIVIYTGKIKSGKTTSLFTLVNKLDSVDGILAPIVNDKRRLFHISSRSIKDLEIEESTAETISVGNYHFLNESFEWANKKIIEASESEVKWLIIDEIGKLELKGEGLNRSAKFVVDQNRNPDRYLLLVVRDYLVDDVIKYYHLEKKNYEVITDINKIIDIT